MVRSQGGQGGRWGSVKGEGLTNQQTQAMTNCNNEDQECSYRDLPDVAEFLGS